MSLNQGFLNNSVYIHPVGVETPFIKEQIILEVVMTNIINSNENCIAIFGVLVATWLWLLQLQYTYIG